MPVHDWTQIDACVFHDFHQAWTVEIRNALNHGILPTDFHAQIIPSANESAVTSSEIDIYARRANRISVQHRLGNVVAVIEVVSPGNKSSHRALRAFVDKAIELLTDGVNLLIIDLFPPSARDPQGIHKAIWDEIRDEPFQLPAEKPLTIAAYSAGEINRAYVEPVGVGDALPCLPIFLEQERYVPAPLESSYQTTWDKSPSIVRELVTAGA